MIFKKCVLMVALFCTTQNMLAAAEEIDDYHVDPSDQYLSRLDASSIEKCFFDTCLYHNAQALHIFLEKQKKALSEVDFKKLINMTTKDGDTQYDNCSMLTMLIQESFINKKDALEKLRILVFYAPDPYVGSLLPLDAVIDSYLKHAVDCKEDLFQESSQENLLIKKGTIKTIPYHLSLCLTILSLLKNIEQDFNYKSEKKTVIYRIIEPCIRRKNITVNDLIIINTLLMLGADPTIEVFVYPEHQYISAVDLVYCCSCYAEYKNADKLYALFKKRGFTASYNIWINSYCVVS